MAERHLELRDRLLAPCVILDEAGEIVGPDSGAVIRRLLLFEEYIIDWYGAGELAALIDLVGADGLITLLESGVLRVRAEAATMGQIGQSTVRKPGRTTEPLPQGTYVLASIVPAAEQKNEHIGRRLEEIRRMPLEKKSNKAVRLAVVDALVDLPAKAGSQALSQLGADVAIGHHMFRVAAAHELKTRAGLSVAPNEFEIRFQDIGNEVYEVKTDIGERFGLAVETLHKVAEHALLAVASLNYRIEQMDTHNALMGFRSGDLPVFEAKLAGLAAAVAPEDQEARFDRVITLAGLPTPEAGTRIDAKRLLEIRNSEEAREFRLWLRTLDHATDEEIKERVASLSARLAGIVHGTPGKAARFAFSTLLSTIPGTGGLAGVALDAFDTFLLEKLIKEPGPMTFLTRSYPSIYDA